MTKWQEKETPFEWAYNNGHDDGYDGAPRKYPNNPNLLEPYDDGYADGECDAQASREAALVGSGEI